jgi:biopolymer transport protein ExbD
MKFRSPSDQLPNMGMQLAPLVDVLFLLLIFFIFSLAIARFETQMDVSVPAADSGTDDKANIGEIVVNVKSDGSIVVQSQPLTQEELLRKLELIASTTPDQAVILRGDVSTPYEKIVNVLDTVQKAGIWNVAFATKRPEGN